MLRRSRRTVEELAAELGLSANAIRGHLARLEQDGLIQPQGLRRRVSKPAALYRLTPQAERLFPRAYAELLTDLLDVLAQEWPLEQREAIVVVDGGSALRLEKTCRCLQKS